MKKLQRLLKKSAATKVALTAVCLVAFAFSTFAGSVTLGWTAAAPVVGSTNSTYNVYSFSLGSATNVTSVSASFTTATVSNLTVGVQYIFYATTVNTYGQESLPSNMVTNTIPFPQPGPPTALMITGQSPR